MAVPLLPKITWDEANEHLLHETPSLEHAPRGLLIRPGLDRLSDERDPGVEDAVLETAKWFTKRHVADDIKRGEVWISWVSPG